MILVTFLWSIAGVVTRHLEQARQFEVTFWRSFFTALSLLILLPWLQGRGVFTRLRQADRVLWWSGLCWSGMFTFFMLSLMLTSVANVLVMMALSPLFTALAARLLLGQRLPSRTWLTIVVAGVAMVYMYGRQFGQGITLTGLLVALCIPVCGAANWIINQFAQGQGRQVDLVPAVLVGAVLSAMMTLPLAWPLQASWHDLGLLAGLGLVQLAIPCTLAVMCTRVLLAPEVALLSLLEVVFGIALAWWGAGEAPTTEVVTGGTLVLLALMGNELLGWRQRQAKARTQIRIQVEQ